jgi:AcrR family transcriptional regulator
VSAAPRTRRTRPSNRRELLIEAATELFAERGYQNVTFADIASAQDLTPAALYRHFASRHELFAESVRASAALFHGIVTHSALRPGGDADAIPAALVDAAHRHRAQAILYLWESAYLPGDTRDPLSTDVVRAWAAVVRQERPWLSRADAEFLASEALGVLAGTVRMLRARHIRDALARIMTAVVRTDLPAPAEGTCGGEGTPASVLTRSRREATLGAAVNLFRRHGYAGTGVDDIGAAAGITGSGVYRHFRSKQDILVAAFRRTGDRFATEATRALATATRENALSRLAEAYVDVAAADVDLLFVYLHEARSLPADVRREMSAIQDGLMGIWEQTLHQCRPDLPAGDARIIVLALAGILNAGVIAGLAADPHHRSRLVSVVLQAAAPPRASSGRGDALRGGQLTPESGG